MVPEHHLRANVFVCCSGCVGEFEKVARDDHATLLERLNQNHDALRIAKLALEDTGPASKRTGCNPYQSLAPSPCSINSTQPSAPMRARMLAMIASSTGTGRSPAPTTRTTPRLYVTARSESPRKSARTDNREITHERPTVPRDRMAHRPRTRGSSVLSKASGD